MGESYSRRDGTHRCAASANVERQRAPYRARCVPDRTVNQGHFAAPRVGDLSSGSDAYEENGEAC